LDTGRRFELRWFLSFTKLDDRMPLWLSAVKNFFTLVLFCFALPASLFQSFLVWVFGGANSITNTLVTLMYYSLGVYITYRHSVWREKNLPVLKKITEK
jgi:thiol:disulfide interchange protein